MTTDARKEHPSITTQRHMITIANHWDELTQALHPGSTGDNAGIRTKPGSTIPINLHVSNVITELKSWTYFLARCLIDETDWTPQPHATTPELLRSIAKFRIGHFTEHPDEALAEAITQDAADYAMLVARTIAPENIKKIHLNIPCHDHGTTTLGERVPCPGKYVTTLLPWRTDIPDMQCDHDPQHTLSPLEWQRAQRRPHPQGIRNLATRLTAS